MKAMLLPCAILLVSALPVSAQDHQHPPDYAPSTPAASAVGHEHISHGDYAAAADLAVMPSPEVPTDWAADNVYGATAMDAARKALFRGTRDTISHLVLVDQLEWRANDGGDAIAWRGKAWYGGDIDRFMLRTEGEARLHGPAEKAEVQALWRHAVGPYANLELGVRQDIRPSPNRTHATVGIDMMLPYWFEVESALFLSHKGDVSARVEVSHDMRLTNALILQPRAELNLSAQDVPELGIGSGLSDGAFGLRLRYAPDPAFAPYIGVNWERKFSDTGRFARSAGESRSATSFVAGLRFWF